MKITKLVRSCIPLGRGCLKGGGCLLLLFFFLLPSISSSAVIKRPSLTSFGLVGHWTMDGKDVNWTSNTITDKSGNGNTGRLTNISTTTSVRAGKVGQALSLNGIDDSQKIDMGDVVALRSPTAITVSAWAKPDTVSDAALKTIVSRDNSAVGRPGFYLAINADDVAFQIASSTYGVNATAMGTNVVDTEWHLYTGTWDGSSVKVFKDGIQQGDAVSFTDWFDASNSHLYIGSMYRNGLTWRNGFPGSLDDVRIYNRALSAAEITKLYNEGQSKVNKQTTPTDLNSGLVGHWTMDGKDINWTANTIADKSGNGNTGTLVSMSTTTSPMAGKIGQGFKFDGVDDYVTTGNSTLGPTITTSYWIKLSRTATGQEMVASFGFASFDVFINIRTLQVQIGNYRQNKTISDNNWHHISVVLNADGSSDLYFDGAKTGVTSAGTNPNFTTESLWLGVAKNNVQYFSGSLDDVRIYNRALSATEISKLYAEGQLKVSSRLWSCGSPLIDVRDLKSYPTVKIGSQCWMKKNLNVGTMVTGATTQGTSCASIQKYCYSNTESNCTTYGGLYQWDQMMCGSVTPGATGICPAGWHVPTHDEFTLLERTTCTSGSCATDFPYNITTTGGRGTNEGATLRSPTGLFRGVLAGYSYASGIFASVGTNGYFWSSLPSGTSAWYHSLFFGNAAVNRFTIGKTYSFSVRCLKD